MLIPWLFVSQLSKRTLIFFFWSLCYSNFNHISQYFILYIEEIVSLSKNSTFSSWQNYKENLLKEIYNYFFPLKNFLLVQCLFGLLRQPRKISWVKEVFHSYLQKGKNKGKESLSCRQGNIHSTARVNDLVFILSMKKAFVYLGGKRHTGKTNLVYLNPSKTSLNRLPC